MDSDEEAARTNPPLPTRSALPEHVRREILELGFPDDGYNYLLHLREINNAGGGSSYYHNRKAKLDQVPIDVKVCARFIRLLHKNKIFLLIFVYLLMKFFVFLMIGI